MVTTHNVLLTTHAQDPANMMPVPSPRTPRTPRTPATSSAAGSVKPMAIFELLEYIVNQPPPR